MLKTTASKARGAQREREREGGREGEREREWGEGRTVCVCGGGGGDRGEMRWGWRGAADPLHPAEAAVYTGLTLPKQIHTHVNTSQQAVYPPSYTFRTH